MYILEKFYTKILHKEAPYYAKYSLLIIIWKPIRKYLNVVIVPNIPFTTLRVAMYRWIGFKIGKNVFIGMKCYLDDVAVDKLTIEDGVTISYGCYFACHGKGQGHMSIVVKKGAYLGMRCNILSGKHGITIGENAMVGAGTLVNKSIVPNSKVAGVPMRDINDEE